MNDARRIEVHIDTLVLPADRSLNPERASTAFRCELERLLAEGGLGGSRANWSVDTLDGVGAATLGTTTSATVGEQLARAVYRGLNR